MRIFEPTLTADWWQRLSPYLVYHHLSNFHSYKHLAGICGNLATVFPWYRQRIFPPATYWWSRIFQLITLQVATIIPIFWMSPCWPGLITENVICKSLLDDRMIPAKLIEDARTWKEEKGLPAECMYMVCIGTEYSSSSSLCDCTKLNKGIDNNFLKAQLISRVK